MLVVEWMTVLTVLCYTVLSKGHAQTEAAHSEWMNLRRSDLTGMSPWMMDSQGNLPKKILPQVGEEIYGSKICKRKNAT